MNTQVSIQVRRALLAREEQQMFQFAMKVAQAALPEHKDKPYFDLGVRSVFIGDVRDESPATLKEVLPALFRSWLSQSRWLLESVDVEGEIQQKGVEAVAELLVAILRGRTKRETLIAGATP